MITEVNYEVASPEAVQGICDLCQSIDSLKEKFRSEVFHNTGTLGGDRRIFFISEGASGDQYTNILAIIDHDRHNPAIVKCFTYPKNIERLITYCNRTFNFGEAAQKLLHGCKVRRLTWPTGYLKVSHDGNIKSHVTIAGKVHVGAASFNIYDLRAEDWVEVEDEQ